MLVPAAVFLAISPAASIPTPALQVERRAAYTIVLPAGGGFDIPAIAGSPVERAIPAVAAYGDQATAPSEPAGSIHVEQTLAGERDPLSGVNRPMFKIQDAIDKAILRPAAMGYKHAVPKPARDGIRNALKNLNEPFVFLNFLLQLKIGKAAETFARFAVNSTAGLGGLFDVAKRKGINLPHRDNSFGDTLGVYGVGPGPYLFIPMIGPTTLRDITGLPIRAVLPLAVGHPFDQAVYQIPTGVLGGLDQRAEADDDLKALNSGAIDPYATMRSAYLQQRQAEIDSLRGHHKNASASSATSQELADPLDDPAAADVPTSMQSPARELRDPLEDPAATAPDPAPPAPQPDLSPKP